MNSPKNRVRGHNGIVIMVNDRFFARYNYKTKRILTAWSLPGSTIYSEVHEMAMSGIEEILKEKGYTPTRRNVFLAMEE